MLLAARRVLTGDGSEARPLTLSIEDGRIAEVVDGVQPGAEVLDGILVPGFVDTHCHGAAGAPFTDPDPAKVQAAIAHHRRHGTTSLVASTVTEALAEVERQVARLRPLVESGELAGIHIEGPFLSPLHKGAHPPELLRPPTAEAVDAILSAGGGAVRMVTIAPELDGALAAIAQLREAGVVAAFGHSDADAATARSSIDAGVTVATHLFNAMRPVHHRSPGPVPVLLDDERVTVEMIADHVHLDPEIVRMIPRAAGQGRVSLVTDAMSATGCADGSYMLGQLAVEVTSGVARLVTDDGSQGAIAGSTLTLDVALRHTAAAAGLVAASLMVATNPARALGLTEVGALAPGRWADACLLDEDSLALRAVLRRGQWVTAPGDRRWDSLPTSTEEAGRE